ncbi:MULTISPECIES: gluconate:H+ symporter [Limosilactobacillus]|uniref:gluconate:H+ symporter n=1 Tax=Limosilactobacillus TaxID=2742598 RepID=UPI00098F2BFA|nr:MULTISPECIES: gluconate:H+ symporter [Limosilactobacillus]WOZ74756.1 gluconate:H+ symporter [Limosilactobacillus reuteri]
MSILIMLIGVALLFLLIIKFRMNTFVSLLIVSLAVGLCLGIPWMKLPTVVEKGIGDQVGHLAIIFGLGAMLGQLISDSGAGFQIANTFTEKFGRKYIELAVVLTSFIIGLAMFFEVGLVILLPIIYAIAVELDVAFLYLALPMAVALNVAHAFLPPHPSPVAVAGILHAPLGSVLLIGLLCAIPVVILAGPVYNHILMKVYPQVYRKNVKIQVLGNIRQPHNDDNLPSFGTSILTATMPLILIILATVIKYILPDSNFISIFLQFIGSPDMAMILSLILAIFTLGIKRGTKMKKIGQSMENAIKQIAMMLLIIGGAGAFKQVLVTGGVANDISSLFIHSNISPLIAAWLIPALLHFCLGSTTVAALTGAGLVAPLVAGTGISPVLMVLAVGAGSTFGDHVNGAGFWMVKEYFGLSLKEALATWSVLTCVTSIIGLLVVLFLSLFI